VHQLNCSNQVPTNTITSAARYSSDRLLMTAPHVDALIAVCVPHSPGHSRLIGLLFTVRVTLQNTVSVLDACCTSSALRALRLDATTPLPFCPNASYSISQAAERSHACDILKAFLRQLPQLSHPAEVVL
jgi:hypothetical protein